jgi:signal transduction histidine kinase
LLFIAPVENRGRVPWLALAVTVALTLAASLYAFLFIQEGVDGRFDAQVAATTAAIQGRLEAYEQVLAGAKALFAASQQVDRDGWINFVSTQRVDERFPGIQGVGYFERVAPDQLQAHIAQVHSEGFSDYVVRPAGDRSEYYPIVFIEPLDARNQKAFGFDVYSEPVRRAAVEEARDTGMTSITRKIILVQETAEDVQAGFLMMVPIYEDENPAMTVEERRANIKGFVYSPFRMNDLMQGISGPTFQDVSFVIYAGEPAEENVLYDHASIEGFSADDFDSSLAKTSAIIIGGRGWTLEFTGLQSTRTAGDIYGPYIILAAGFVFSGLLFYILRSAGNLRNNLQELVRVTDQIAKGNMDVEIEKKLLDSGGSVGSLAWHFDSMKENVRKHTQELEEANKELRRLDTLKDEFINVAAHELRNPITPMLIMIENLQEEFGQREEVKVIARNARKIHELVKSILNVARLENQSIVLEKERFDLDSILADAAQDAKKQAKGVQIAYEPATIMVNADRWKVAEVVLNLVDNAIKFSNEGTITISARQDGKEAVVSIRDCGTGIHPEIMPKLFTKFATKSDKGTGIGLYFSKKIVDAHGGAIWAENNAGGNGATFSFSLPLKEPETQITPEKVKASDVQR